MPLVPGKVGSMVDRTGRKLANSFLNADNRCLPGVRTTPWSDRSPAAPLGYPAVGSGSVPIFLNRFRVADQVAVVTGGGGGIGSAIGAALGEAGARVILADVSEEAAVRAAQGLCSRGMVADARHVDVADEAGVDALFAGIAADFGRIDIVVNAAGIALRARAVDHTLENWEKVMRVNATGTFLCCRSAARHMIPSKRGAIVNIASIMGVSGGGIYPNVSYHTSKGAVVNLTRTLALEWACHNIRVNAIAPTYVRTEFIRPLLAVEELVKRIGAITPLGRLAEPDDVASAALYLASPAAAMVTGHILAVDGGFLAQ